MTFSKLKNLVISTKGVSVPACSLRDNGDIKFDLLIHQTILAWSKQANSEFSFSFLCSRESKLSEAWSAKYEAVVLCLTGSILGSEQIVSSVFVELPQVAS